MGIDESSDGDEANGMPQASGERHEHSERLVFSGLTAVVMVVPPLPVFALLSSSQAPVIAVLPVGFYGPSIVVGRLRRPPNVIIPVTRVVRPVSCRDAGRAGCKGEHQEGQREKAADYCPHSSSDSYLTSVIRKDFGVRRVQES